VGKHRRRYEGIDPEVEEDGQEHLRQMLETDDEFRREWEANRTKRELGMFILEKRLELGLSQRELADRVGTSQNRIYLIESGQVDVRLATLQRLAEALGFPVIVGDKTFAG
jgi:ribosome-binding protein aMBF1 (putative translation factor)